MQRYLYQVLMQTPMGEKSGTLELCLEDGRAEGYLDILGRREPCQGIVDQEGHCQLSGNIVTLVQRISYTASGHLDRHGIELTMVGPYSTLQLRGEARQLEEV